MATIRWQAVRAQAFSFNTSTLYQAKRDKQRNATRRRSIKEKWALQAARTWGKATKL